MTFDKLFNNKCIYVKDKAAMVTWGMSGESKAVKIALQLALN